MSNLDELQKIIDAEFSQELTNEEALEFILDCPIFVIQQIILLGYKMGIAGGLTPHDALEISLRSYIKTFGEVENE